MTYVRKYVQENEKSCNSYECNQGKETLNRFKNQELNNGPILLLEKKFLHYNAKENPNNNNNNSNEIKGKMNEIATILHYENDPNTEEDTIIILILIMVNILKIFFHCLNKKNIQISLM